MPTVRRIYVETPTDRQVFHVTDDDIAPMIRTARLRLHEAREQQRLATMRVIQAERWEALCDALEAAVDRMQLDPTAIEVNEQAVRNYEHAGYHPTHEEPADDDALPRPLLAP